MTRGIIIFLTMAIATVGLAFAIHYLLGSQENSGEQVEEPSNTLELASNTLQETSSATSSISTPLHTFSSGLEVRLEEANHYTYRPEQQTDILAFSVYHLHLTNTGDEPVTVNRSVRSCVVDGLVHTYERDLNPDTAITPVLVDLEAGESMRLPVGCDTHDPDAELAYPLSPEGTNETYLVTN